MTPEQREELKQAAQGADQDGQHIYTNPRDSNNWRNNDAFNAAASPAVVLSLIAQVEALTVPQWISVETALPKCSKKPNSLGVEVIVYPQPESGESSAFFGCRVTDKPGFYKYGHMVKGVTHWMYIPTIPAIPETKEGA